MEMGEGELLWMYDTHKPAVCDMQRCMTPPIHNGAYL
jgi:hypothetical protein